MKKIREWISARALSCFIAVSSLFPGNISSETHPSAPSNKSNTTEVTEDNCSDVNGSDKYHYNSNLDNETKNDDISAKLASDFNSTGLNTSPNPAAHNDLAPENKGLCLDFEKAATPTPMYRQGHIERADYVFEARKPDMPLMSNGRDNIQIFPASLTKLITATAYYYCRDNGLIDFKNAEEEKHCEDLIDRMLHLKHKSDIPTYNLAAQKMGAFLESQPKIQAIANQRGVPKDRPFQIFSDVIVPMVAEEVGMEDVRIFSPCGLPWGYIGRQSDEYLYANRGTPADFAHLIDYNLKHYKDQILEKTGGRYDIPGCIAWKTGTSDDGNNAISVSERNGKTVIAMTFGTGGGINRKDRVANLTNDGFQILNKKDQANNYQSPISQAPKIQFVPNFGG